MANDTLSINLIRGHEKSSVEKLLQWALSAGRLIVILTEFIALSAFVYRFSLDRQLVDLNDQIKQKQLIVESLKNDEALYRSLQMRIATASKLQDQSSASLTLYTDIVKLAQGKLRFESMTMDEKTIRITATTNNVSQANSFVKALKSHKNTEKVILERVENNVSLSSIIVNIIVVLKQEV